MGNNTCIQLCKFETVKVQMHVNNLPVYDPQTKEVIGFEINFARVPQREFKPANILQLVSEAYKKHTQNGTELRRHLHTMEVTQKGDIHTSVVKTKASFITVVASLSQGELQAFCTAALSTPTRETVYIEYENVNIDSKLTFKQCPSADVIKKQRSAWGNILSYGKGAIKTFNEMRGTEIGKRIEQQVRASVQDAVANAAEELKDRAQQEVARSLEDAV